MTTTASLSPQIEEIKTTLTALLAADRKDEALALFISLLSQLATDHDRLQHQLRLLLKQRFGRKTERIDPAQLRLLLEELQAEAQAATPAAAEQPVVAHVRRRPIERRAGRTAELVGNRRNVPAASSGGAPHNGEVRIISVMESSP